ncbi:MAG TPA: AAA family ATPase [Clostridiales bacterium]|nr:AAA family ATPase [Clostridiales bacterium]
MIEVELIELINKVQMMKTETQTIELKAAHQGCPKKLYDTLSSFSNQDSGGTILFGIDEKSGYEIVGVYDIHDLQKRVNEQCKQMTPAIRPVFTAVKLKEGNVVSAEIPGIDISERPCYYSGVGRTKGSFVRSGDSDEPMSDYEIYSYEAFRKKYQDDIRINEKATFDTIDERRLNNYIEIIKDNNPKLAKLPEEDIKKFLNMIVDGKPTLVCTLLFSIYPQMFYPQYTANAMVVMGYEKGDIADDGSRFIDNRRIEGNLIDILEETMKFLTKNMRVKTIIDNETGKRADKTEYPIVALREALLNAIIHRDYSIHTEAMPIEVIMYKDRLEVRNPGGLYGRLTIDKLGKVQPDTRNPVLARALETLGVTENRYSGIPTIQRELKATGMKEAKFQDLRNEFIVTFYNDNSGIQEHKDVDPRHNLLEFCIEPKSRKEIAEFLDIKTIYYVTQNFINPLVDEGKLRLKLPDRPKSKNQKYYSVL